MGAFWGGGWGYGPRWGYGSVHINVNNRYVNHYNRYNTVNRYGGANGNWNHNPAHRGAAPYGDRATANRYGGSARGDSVATRQTAARTQPAGAANRAGASAGNTSAGANRAGAGNTSAAPARSRMMPPIAMRTRISLILSDMMLPRRVLLLP
jgi:hypothetical protein